MVEATGDRLPISVCVPTKNEADTIDRCLESVDGWVDEIVVLDSDSEDGTRAICASYGATVTQYEFDGFTDMYRTGLDYARNEWVLFLDADEAVTAALREEIAETLGETDAVAFEIPLRTYMFGEHVHTTQSKTCLARAHAFEFGREYVHSQMGVRDRYRDRVVELSNPIEHYTYDRVSEYLSKFDRYTSLEALRHVESGSRPSYPWFLGKALAVCGYHLFVNRGILDGYRGVLFATMSFQYVLATHAKMKDIERLRSDDPDGWREVWLEEECQR